MAKATVRDRLKHLLLEPHYPDVGIEFNSDAIRLAVSQVEKGKPGIVHIDSEPLPAGCMDINPLRPNIVHMEPAADALRALWSRNRFKNGKVCLLLQDRAAVTSQVTLEHGAKTPQECMDLLRFKLKKSLPFRMEEAIVSFFNPEGVPVHGSSLLWASVIHNTVLHQYEQFVGSTIDTECGLVDLSTFNTINLAHAHIRKSGAQESDLLFVNLNQGYISIAITQKGRLSFFRNRTMEKAQGAASEALAEIHPTTMYYLDKLGGEKLSGACVYAVDEGEELCTKMEQEFGIPAFLLSIDEFSGTRFDASNRHLLQSFVPLAGMLLSKKVEFA